MIYYLSTMTHKALFIIVTLLIIQLALCYKGVDVSQLYHQSVYECLKKDGYSFSVPRGYHSYGGIDNNAVANLQNAKAAGLNTDVYLFPCRSKNPASQVSEMMGGIPSNLYGMIWLDIETNPSTGCGWSNDHNSNCVFLTELTNAVKAKGKKVGIYASSSMWTSIFGSTKACSDVAFAPLWYAHYDKVASFNDFAPFGGWSKPNIKQYQGSASLCGATVDLNYYP